MSQCQLRPPPPPQARVGVKGGLVGARIRKHSQEGREFEAFRIYFSPRYGDCLGLAIFIYNIHYKQLFASV